MKIPFCYLCCILLLSSGCGRSGFSMVEITCISEGKNCGTISDGYGGSLECGTCTAPQTCGGAGEENVCGCTPTTCLLEGSNCGTILDDCGGTLDCGTCVAPETCAGGNIQNVCGCIPTTCAIESKNCGPFSDDCGSMLDCGACTSPESCGGTGISNVCGAPPLNVWVRIDSGSFTMGSPETELGRNIDEIQHEVTLTHDIEIRSNEVTQGEFEALMTWNPSLLVGPDRLDCPVEAISWYDAAAYANQLSAQAGYTPCYSLSNVVCEDTSEVDSSYMACMNEIQRGISSASASLNGVSSPYDCTGYRLPTEAEWEYAARGRDQRATYNGDLSPGNLVCEQPNQVLDIVAWFCGNSDETTHDIGSHTANGNGLYDMLGNVWEWCHDWYDDYPDTITDPVGPPGGTRHVVRGGSWDLGAAYARAAIRYWLVPGYRVNSLGFRLVRTLP